MKPLDGFAGRLVPRYGVDPPIRICWNTAARHALLRWQDRSRPAEIRNVSLLGALIAVEGDVDIDIGTVVQIEREGHPGLVKVRRLFTSEPGVTMVGVEFLDVAGAVPDLDELIAHSRDVQPSRGRTSSAKRTICSS